MSEWISVDDRLPLEPSSIENKIVTVIITDGLEVGKGDYWTGTKPKPWGDWSSSSDINGSEITHWQPLPCPPESQ